MTTPEISNDPKMEMAVVKGFSCPDVAVHAGSDDDALASRLMV